MTFCENLRLVLKPPKSARVNNAVPVSFVVVTIRMGGLWMTSSKRLFKGHGITGQFLFAWRMHQAFSPPRLKTRRPDLDYSTQRDLFRNLRRNFPKAHAASRQEQNLAETTRQSCSQSPISNLKLQTKAVPKTRIVPPQFHSSLRPHLPMNIRDCKG